MAQSLLSRTHHLHHDHLAAAFSSSPRPPLSRRRLAAAPLTLAKISVPSRLSSRPSSTVVRAMPPSGSSGGTNPSVPPNPGKAPGPGLPLPNIPIWARYILGSIFCVAIPLYRRLRMIEETVETTVEVVEEVAKVTKKVADDIVEALPDGGLKTVALEVEEIANEVIVDAEQVKSFLHKVDEIKEEVEELAKPITKEVEMLEKDGK